MPGTGRNHPIETPVRRTPLKMEKSTAQRSWTAWPNGRTDPSTASTRVLFMDAINVKIEDGQVANRPVYVVMAVTVDGTRDILGIWAGDGGEGAKCGLKRRCA